MTTRTRRSERTTASHPQPGHDVVAEIRASAALTATRAELAALAARTEAAERQRDEMARELGAARRDLAALNACLVELRELAGRGLGHQLLDTAARHEVSDPTAIPLLGLRRAARLAFAVDATRRDATRDSTTAPQD